MNGIPRKKVLQEGNGPLLECLGKDSVVRVEERVSRDLPSLVPWDILLVNEDAHEFGDRKCRVRLRSNLKVRTDQSPEAICARTSLSWMETSVHAIGDLMS